MQHKYMLFFAIFSLLLFLPKAHASNSTCIWHTGGLGSLVVDETDLRIGDKTFVTIDDGTYGKELFTVTGGSSGTELLKDINPGSGNSNPSSGVLLNGYMYFAASDGTNGQELWVTDGTSSGTQMVKDICSGSIGSNTSYLFVWNNKIYFSANDGTSGAELWVSDGTSGGTERIADINSGSNSSSPTTFTEYNGYLYFSAYSDGEGRELWRTDGSTVELVTDIVSGSSSSSPQGFGVVNNKLVFVADSKLRVYEGTGSVSLLDFDVNGTSTGVMGGYLYYCGGSSSDNQLWRTDGTSGGTEMVKDLNPGSNCMATGFTLSGDQLFFYAYDPTYGLELHVTDGTSSGTSFVKDMTPSGNTSFYQMLPFHNVLYLNIYDGTGYNIWRSDGTSAGSYLVTEPSGTGDSNNFYISICGDFLLFDATVSSTNRVYAWAATPTKSLVRNKWQMVGVPIVPETGQETATQLFQDDLGGSAPNGSNWCLSRWDAANECFVRFGELESDGSDLGDPHNFTPGYGYWIIQDVDDNATLTIDDNQVAHLPENDDDPAIPIVGMSSDPAYRGLNMLANPYYQSFTMDHALFYYNGAGAEIEFGTRVGNGDVSGNIYTWDPTAGSSGQYVTTVYSSASIDPWEGFWIEMLVAAESGLVLTLYPPDEVVGAGKKGGGSTCELDQGDGWTLDLPLRSLDGAYLDEYNRIGIGENSCDQFDAWDGSEFSPMGGRFVQMYFDHPEWTSLAKKFTFDLRDTDFRNCVKEWDATVRIWRIPNSEFELSWPEIDEIDPAYNFTLIDNSYGEPVEIEMRHHSSVRFTTGEFTGDYEYRHFTIRVEKDADLGGEEPVITLLPEFYNFAPAYPNPFNPTSTLTVALPQASRLQVQVYNLLGQKVATLADGHYEAGYQKIIFNGGSLASGTYLVRASVPGELDVTRKLQLVK